MVCTNEFRNLCAHAELRFEFYGVLGSIHAHYTVWYLLVCARARNVFSQQHISLTSLWFWSVCPLVLGQHRSVVSFLRREIWRRRNEEVQYKSWSQAKIKNTGRVALQSKKRKPQTTLICPCASVPTTKSSKEWMVRVYDVVWDSAWLWKLEICKKCVNIPICVKFTSNYWWVKGELWRKSMHRCSAKRLQLSTLVLFWAFCLRNTICR